MSEISLYEALGVTKTATKAEIKTAYQRIAMKNHPDMVKNKKDLTQAQKDEAIAKFKLATEAEGILSDDKLRAAYDQFGMKGIENVRAGKGASSGQSYTDAAGPVKRRTYSEDDLMDFFGKSKERREREEASSGSDDGLTSEQRRAKAREERLKRRGTENGSSSTPSGNDNSHESSTPSSSVPERGTASGVFRDVAEKINDASEKLRGVEVPLEALQKFREDLSSFLGEIDSAISRAKRGPGRFNP